MTGAYIDKCQYSQTSKITKKLLSPLNSPPLICAEYEISSKSTHLSLFVQSYGLKNDSANIGKCQESQKLSSLVNSAPSNCSVRKISWKMANLISHSLFPFLKIAYFKLRYGREETRISKIGSKSS